MISNEQDTGVSPDGAGLSSLRDRAASVSPVPASIPDALGIECEHHYGITTHDFRDGMTPGDVAYWLIRNAWHIEALTDENHTWEIVEKEAPGWSYVRIIKNEKSPRFALCPVWYPDGPGQTWFTQKFRVASVTTIAWEVAKHLTHAERWDADAIKQRDTIKGRKARTKYTRWAADARRSADLVRSRWPQAYRLERSGWQQRMHEYRVVLEGDAPKGGPHG